MSRRFAQTSAQGAAAEAFLKPRLERFLGEPLEEQDRFARLDFKGATTGFHEVKSRAPCYKSDDKYAEKGWFIGVPKIAAALCCAEPVTFWYYFLSDSTLWKLPFDPDLFSQFKPFVNAQGQETIAIPKKFWTQVLLDV